MQQKLVCPACNADIPADSINVEQTIAVCPVCDTVFDFGSLTTYPKKKKPREIRLPRGLHIKDTANGIEMSWRWFNPSVLFLTFFVIGWDSLLIFWYLMAFNMPMTGGMNWMVIVFPVAHVTIGVGLTYHVLSVWLNRTVVNINPERIKVRTAPILHPWQDITLTCDEIEQVYVKQNFGQNNGVSYDLVARRHGGFEDVLAHGVPRADFAHAVEQEIEGYLGIEDVPMAGSWDI